MPIVYYLKFEFFCILVGGNIHWPTSDTKDVWQTYWLYTLVGHLLNTSSTCPVMFYKDPSILVCFSYPKKGLERRLYISQPQFGSHTTQQPKHCFYSYSLSIVQVLFASHEAIQRKTVHKCSLNVAQVVYRFHKGSFCPAMIYKSTS